MNAPHPDYTTKDSPWPVAETADRFAGLITERGMTIFATIDQRAAAHRAGMELRDTVLIIFGSPAAGTPVMDAQPLAALDLPLKLLVWDDDGHTRVSYLTPAVRGRAIRAARVARGATGRNRGPGRRSAPRRSALTATASTRSGPRVPACRGVTLGR